MLASPSYCPAISTLWRIRRIQPQHASVEAVHSNSRDDFVRGSSFSQTPPQGAARLLLIHLARVCPKANLGFVPLLQLANVLSIRIFYEYALHRPRPLQTLAAVKLLTSTNQRQSSTSARTLGAFLVYFPSYHFQPCPSRFLSTRHFRIITMLDDAQNLLEIKSVSCNEPTCVFNAQ